MNSPNSYDLPGGLPGSLHGSSAPPNSDTQPNKINSLSIQSNKIQIGKLPYYILEKIVFSQLGARRPDVLVHSRLGEDCSVIDFGDMVCILSTDPITGTTTGIGWFAVHISCNDVAANGAEPVGVLVTILAPPGSTEEDFKAVMTEADRAAKRLGIEILGGHSEVTSSVTRMTVVSTAVGKARKDAFVTSSGAKPGDAIIVTKSAGLEGTAILASTFRQKLIEKGIARDMISRAEGFLEFISVVPEGIIAGKNGATAMHDATEGGLVAAILEICEASGVGVELWEEDIPIAPETRDICRALEIDPLKLISSGCMVITAKEPGKIVDSLAASGIKASIVGKILKAPCERVMISQKTPIGEGRGGHLTAGLEFPERDELYRALTGG